MPSRYSNCKKKIQKKGVTLTLMQCIEHICISSWYFINCFLVILILGFLISYIFSQCHNTTTSRIADFLCKFLICFTWFWQCSARRFPLPQNNAKNMKDSLSSVYLASYIVL